MLLCERTPVLRPHFCVSRSEAIEALLKDSFKPNEWAN